MQHMSSLVPIGRRKEFQAEVYGVCHKSEGQYFSAALVSAFVQRKRATVFALQKGYIYISIDPASHQKSIMGMVAFGLSNTGQTVVMGLAAVNVARCEPVHVQSLVRTFVRNTLAATPFVTQRTVIPIVECNNNDVIAAAIVTAVRLAIEHFGGQTVAYTLPSTSKLFEKNITPGIGVWTTDMNKLAGIQELQTHFIEGRLVLAQNIASVSRNALDNRRKQGVNQWSTSASTAAQVLATKNITELEAQLLRIKDNEKGTISGKTSHGHNDDIAIALVFGVYWSTAFRLLEFEQARK